MMGGAGGRYFGDGLEAAGAGPRAASGNPTVSYPMMSPELPPYPYLLQSTDTKQERKSEYHIHRISGQKKKKEKG